MPNLWNEMEYTKISTKFTNNTCHCGEIYRKLSLEVFSHSIVRGLRRISSTLTSYYTLH